jgi:hypothetical protein
VAVVENAIRAQRRDEVELGRAAHTGDVGAERLGQLDRIRPDAAGGTDDEHGLAGLHAPSVDQRLERSAGRDGHHGGLDEGQGRRLVGELALLGHRVLRERPAGHPVHLVADREPGHR